MEAGERRSGWQGHSRLCWSLLLALAGCATSRAPIDRALQAQNAQAPRAAQSATAYVINCPDVVEIEINTRPDLHARREIGPDGRIDLPTLGRFRVEGQTTAEVGRRLGDAL